MLDHKGEKYQSYVKTLCYEIENRSSGEDIETIYFGGGTPSILPVDLIAKILKQLRKNFKVRSDVEITLETNPGTVDKLKLANLRELGVNRLSIGVQTFSESLIKKLARGHTVKEALDTIHWAQELGFENINLDLIYGLPKQSFVDWQKTIDKAFEQGINHISCYSLTIEENTPFHNIYGNSNHPDLPDEDLLFEMYEELQRYCLKKGFNQYEVSNFAKPGFESKHNLTYWRNQEFYGFGVSAHEYIQGQRKAHTRDLQNYLEASFGQETLDCNPQLEELMLKLRLKEGLNLKEYKSRFGIDLIQDKGDLLTEYIEKGLISINKDNCNLTYKGFLLSTQIISQLI